MHLPFPFLSISHLACGITYCLECETNHDSCLLCRDGTLRMKENNDYICAGTSITILLIIVCAVMLLCVGFYSVISHLSVELEEEEQHERELLDKEKLECKTKLPYFISLYSLLFHLSLFSPYSEDITSYNMFPYSCGICCIWCHCTLSLPSYWS